MGKRWIRMGLAAAVVAACMLVAACNANPPLPGNGASPPAATAGGSVSGADVAISPTPPPAAGASGTASATPAASPDATPSASSQASGGVHTSPGAQPPVQPPSTAQPPASSAPPASPVKPPPEAAHQVTLSVAGNADWGQIVALAAVSLKKDDTVADVLIRTLKAHKLAYETRGSGKLFYVSGIDGLFEFDDGPTSGWKYRVNGSVQGVGAGSYDLKPGDRIEWFYVSEDQAAKDNTDRQGTAP